MMAQHVPHLASDKRRVKVYELRDNDWFDRGTGFCDTATTTTEDGREDPRVIVEAEDQPERLLLDTRVHKEDGFQKQTETLIVWQEPDSGVDMALSFQEADGCAMIWRFVSKIQEALQNNTAVADDTIDDDLAMEMPPAVSLPPVELGNLAEIESSMRAMASTTNGRDALAKAIMEEGYIGKLIPLVEVAEDLESLADLHRLCNIMKTILLLNDTTIIERAVSDECVLGVVGALEYDPDFPNHKANHRLWLDNQGRFKEVVPIKDKKTREKIHQTYRLQYLKDVVLARILDDPTFSVLNSLIFFNQVEIVQHLQSNSAFLSELFGIFTPRRRDQEKRKEAVLFIQQCCAIAKNIQAPARQTLYNNFIAHGLLSVIHFGLRHADVAVRVGATDILISIIDHDPHMIRQTIYRQMHDNQSGLTDSLVDLLLVEVDLGVKSQIGEALKVLLDQGMVPQGPEHFAKAANGEPPAGRPRPQPSLDPQQELFLTRFYERSAPRLFQPLLDLEGRGDMKLTVQQASMYSCLVEILDFFIRQHHRFSRYLVLNNNLAYCVCQLLKSPEKHLQLTAIRFFRHLIGNQEEFYIKHLTEKEVLCPILDLVFETLPRDNLLSSASLELFDYIRKESIAEMIKYLVVNFRPRLVMLSSLPTFRDMLLRYDQTQGFTVNVDYVVEGENDFARRPPPANVRLMEQISVDPVEEQYWNTSDPDDDDDDDDDDEDDDGHRRGTAMKATTNGTSTPSKPLVDYQSDEDSDGDGVTEAKAKDDMVPPPPERISEKRRREEDEEDELGKLLNSKRRSRSVTDLANSPGVRKAHRRRSFTPHSGNGPPRKIAISLSSTARMGLDDKPGEES